MWDPCPSAGAKSLCIRQGSCSVMDGTSVCQPQYTGGTAAFKPPFAGQRHLPRTEQLRFSVEFTLRPSENAREAFAKGKPATLTPFGAGQDPVT